MIEYNGTNYELRYSLKRVEMLENAIKKPLMSIVASGFLTLTELCACVGYGIKVEGAEGYLSPKQGMEIAEAKLKEDGAYISLSDEVADALERDCPFFFPKG